MYKLSSDHHDFAINQHAMVSVVDKDGVIVYTNQKTCDFVGYTTKELLGQSYTLTASGGHHPFFFLRALVTLKKGGVWRGDVSERHKDGSLRWSRVTVVPFMGSTYQPKQYFVVRTDVTSLKDIGFKLHRANLAKSDFLSTMSHEIRTPLNALLGTAQVLENTKLSYEQRRMLGDISRSGRILLGQLNDVLDFSKIEAGRMDLEVVPFSLRGVVSEVESLMGAVARNKNLVLRVDIDDSFDRMLLGDRMRLMQVLTNLVGNAIKFTTEGCVILRARTQFKFDNKQCVHFSVIDTGIGIAPAVQKLLFEPFAQANGAVSRHYGGTGLGLSICKRLISLMQGDIGVLSEVGQGSTFWFDITYELGDEMAYEVSQVLDNHVNAGSSPKKLLGRCLLVVDDNDMNRVFLQRLLGQEGATVVLAENGQVAVNLLQQDPNAFDAVLMDIQMPVLDGLAAIKFIRSKLLLTALPLLACSAGVHPKDRELALSVGASEFIVKPIGREDILTKLGHLMKPILDPQEHVSGSFALNVSSIKNGWPEIQGLNVQKVREDLGDDFEFFVLMLSKLLDTLREALEYLPKEIIHGGAGMRLHKLRGSLGTLHANDLTLICRQLEDFLKEGKIQSMIDQWKKFEAHAKALIARIEVVVQSKSR